MADTLQAVSWMLEQSCPLRGAHEWSNELLARARTYGRYIARPNDSFGLHDGICVTAKQYAPKTDLLLPVDGFDFAPTFAPLSGEGLERMCAACPAHAAAIAVVGCTGHLYLFPNATQLDDNLREVAADLGLTEAIEREFLPTRLLWFGFWIESPLSRGAMEILRPLINEFALRLNETERERANLFDLVRALDAALENDLNLHIQFFPPGHTDFGWHTTFAHCPRCKAGAPLPRWQETTSQNMECEMCGFDFDPAATAKMETMERENREETNLLKNMGAERYRNFANGYLIERGASVEAAQQAVDSFFESEKNRRENRAKTKRKHAWQRDVLIKGLGRLRATAEAESATVGSFWLSVAEVEQLIERCRQWNIEIYSITHCADEDESNGQVARVKEFGSLEAAFLSLRAQGCDESFYVGSAKVPDELVETASEDERTEQSS